MPDLTFVLPHWLYWAGLVVFPLAAMALVKREQALGGLTGVSLPLGYMLLVTAGFVGLHRFYLRNWVGIFYVPLFVGILVANNAASDARNAGSLAESDILVAEFDVELGQEDVAAGLDGAAAQLAAAEKALTAARAEVALGKAGFERWSDIARYLAGAIALFLFVDTILLPGMVRRCRAREALEPPQPPEPELTERVAGTDEDPTLAVSTPLTDKIERISRFSGEFVAYWSVIAVLAYYYEVIARYIFNSPTNWVHESMFLLFGMQYLISGAYAYMTDSHVRVDIFYTRLSVRGKAITDILTSVFFFIFAGTLLVTGWIFTMDSVGVWEVSFTEWGIQYWPVKATLVLGAVLIGLQGVAKLIKDIAILTTGDAGLGGRTGAA